MTDSLGQVYPLVSVNLTVKDKSQQGDAAESIGQLSIMLHDTIQRKQGG